MFLICWGQSLTPNVQHDDACRNSDGDTLSTWPGLFQCIHEEALVQFEYTPEELSMAGSDTVHQSDSEGHKARLKRVVNNLLRQSAIKQFEIDQNVSVAT